jgi:hypothetical protein
VDIEIAVVWISMMDSDIEEAARNAASTLPDARIRFFFDPGQLSGKAMATRLGKSGEVAWDIYMFFQPGILWTDLPPAPDVYMHQLVDSWADQSHLFQDQDLENELHKAMRTFSGKEIYADQ